MDWLVVFVREIILLFLTIRFCIEWVGVELKISLLLPRLTLFQYYWWLFSFLRFVIFFVDYIFLFHYCVLWIVKRLLKLLYYRLRHLKSIILRQKLRSHFRYQLTFIFMRWVCCSGPFIPSFDRMFLIKCLIRLYSWLLNRREIHIACLLKLLNNLRVF